MFYLLHAHRPLHTIHTPLQCSQILYKKEHKALPDRVASTPAHAALPCELFSELAFLLRSLIKLSPPPQTHPAETTSKRLNHSTVQPPRFHAVPLIYSSAATGCCCYPSFHLRQHQLPPHTHCLNVTLKPPRGTCGCQQEWMEALMVEFPPVPEQDLPYADPAALPAPPPSSAPRAPTDGCPSSAPPCTHALIRRFAIAWHGKSRPD